MRKTFLICSLGGRLTNLIQLISSIKNYSDWNVDVVLQKYEINEQVIVEEHLKATFANRYVIYKSDNMTGPHLARCIALDKHDSDVWCILDDDMLAVDGYTFYDKMAQIIIDKPNIGILSSNWRKTNAMLQKVDLQELLKKQNIVYTGGGMMLRQDVVNIIKDIPRVQYLFDNPLWSIYSYVNGYDNFRYLGSAAIHEVCTKGGRRKWISESDVRKALPPSEWLTVRKGTGKQGCFDEYLICDSRDVTPKAHKLHLKNRRSG